MINNLTVVIKEIKIITIRKICTAVNKVAHNRKYKIRNTAKTVKLFSHQIFNFSSLVMNNIVKKKYIDIDINKKNYLNKNNNTVIRCYKNENQYKI